MLVVKWSIIILFAVVLQDSLEIHLLDVSQKKVSLLFSSANYYSEMFVLTFTYSYLVHVHYFLERPLPEAPSGNPCVPSPCGLNSQCRVVGNTPACSCLPNYIGRAPNCRPECSINAECPGNLACVNERCKDPCPGSCGVHANCVVNKHAPVCSCITGYSGDPFAGCSLIPSKEIMYFIWIIYKLTSNSPISISV